LSRVVLVRHALSVADPDVDSRFWRLADGAFAEAERLARSLPDDVGGPVWASSETKAVETAHAIANVLNADVAVDDRFGEVSRPWTAGDYRSLAKRYLAGEPVDGWEPADAVRQRFASAVAETATGRAVVIVDHGLAMSLYASAVVPLDVVAFWEALAFPDAWLIADGALSHVGAEPPPARDQT
jgi:broad specificity phosphatase PhoE